MPSIPGSGTKTIYLHYGNAALSPASNGGSTFEFFDNFESPSLGYYPLSVPTTVMTQTLPWETTAPHTMSVLEVNRDYRYYGYYGLQDCGGGIGLARSNDLIHWVKDAQPLITSSEDPRWASAVQVGGITYLIYNNNYCYSTQIVYRTSTDSLNFGAVSRLSRIPERIGISIPISSTILTTVGSISITQTRMKTAPLKSLKSAMPQPSPGLAIQFRDDAAAV